MTHLDDWLASRPPAVRALAEEFPLGLVIEIDGEEHWLVGYTESDMLIVTPVDPAEDFDAAMMLRTHLCAAHVREARKTDA